MKAAGMQTAVTEAAGLEALLLCSQLCVELGQGAYPAACVITALHLELT